MRRVRSRAPAGPWSLLASQSVSFAPETAPWASAEEGKNQNIFVIGDKGRAQLTRTHGKDVKEVVQDVGKIRITFSQVRLKDLAGLPQHGA
jgi:hypothetical protein